MGGGIILILVIVVCACTCSMRGKLKKVCGAIIYTRKLTILSLLFYYCDVSRSF